MNALLETPPDFRIDDAGTVHVCAWCHPLLPDLVRKYPALKNRVFTHGICQKHKTEMQESALLLCSKN